MIDDSSTSWPVIRNGGSRESQGLELAEPRRAKFGVFGRLSAAQQRRMQTTRGFHARGGFPPAAQTLTTRFSAAPPAR